MASTTTTSTCGRDVRVTLGVDIVAARASSASSCAAVVVDADAGHVRIGTGLGHDGGRRRRNR